MRDLVVAGGGPVGLAAALHAHRLGLHHPADGRWVEYTSEPPPDLAHALDVLRAAA